MTLSEKAKEYTLVTSVLFFMTYILAGSIYVIYLLYRLLLPDWILFPTVLMASIYFFDSIPYQHHWNPSIRELYPHRQWKTERVAMNLLHRIHFLPASRRGRLSEMLPAELWSIILDHVIDVPFVFDTACDAKNFNIFISRQEFQTHSWEYNLSEKKRKRLRLVCRLWASLLDQRKTRWLASARSWNGSGTHLLRADLQVGPISLDPVTFDPPFVGIVESMEVSGEQIAPLTTLALRKYLHVFPGNMHETFRQYFLPHAKDFSSIRSLIFGWERIIPADFLLGIQQSFSHITFLHLEGDFAEGILTLDRLDILRLDVLPRQVRSWWFPSLRHLALGSRYIADRSVNTEPIPAATDRLLSVLLPNEHSTLYADGAFWSRFPSLQFLGVRLQSFSVVDDPPPDHPLAYLSLAEAYTYATLGTARIEITALDVEHFSTTVSRLPLLQRVTMPVVIDKLRERYPSEWRDLFRIHQSRGLKWVDETGNPINALKHQEARRHRWWEARANHAFVGYCIFFVWFILYHELPQHIYRSLLAPLYVLPSVYLLWSIYGQRTVE